MLTTQATRGNYDLVQDRPDGLWVVRFPSDEFRAWAYWLRSELDYRFIPKGLTVWSRFPPTDQMNADRVAQAISEVRDFKTGKDGKGPPISTRPVRAHPEPWDGCVPSAEDLKEWLSFDIRPRDE